MSPALARVLPAPMPVRFLKLSGEAIECSLETANSSELQRNSVSSMVFLDVSITFHCFSSYFIYLLFMFHHTSTCFIPFHIMCSSWFIIIRLISHPEEVPQALSRPHMDVGAVPHGCTAAAACDLLRKQLKGSARLIDETGKLLAGSSAVYNRTLALI